ncbi:serine/threonine-protein kinase TNNI3K-like [Camellia sinensis]|uniref:serine/threonine-protein kinase TNNI3K-like n=1 Tax=Camellia sinensis TaxID=4442 RepID=UPI0010366046|nr:serine/threonine-protein kinase TNNI3K-like [Camellia sinensis]
MKGKVEIVKLLVDACPESVKEATAMGETCLHLAVVYNKVKVFQYLVKWLEERIDNGDLINRKGRGGNTVLHLATSRKQLQTLKILLDNQSLNKMVEVNAKNSGGFTPLDILDVLPYSRKIDMEISKILRQAGAMGARDIADQSFNCGDDNYSQPPPHMSTIMSILKFRRETYNAVLLVTATLLTTITFLGFTSSGALVIFLLHEFPLKPWPQISVLAMFGAYMCSIMAVSPNEAWAMLWLAIPFLLLAAGGKFCGLGRQRPYAGCRDRDA